MTKHEDMVALRNHPDIHYNCAQSVLIPFAEDMGITREQANALALDFGGGMGCGSVCGAITGALMAMGGLDVPQEKRVELMEAFRKNHGCIDCQELVKGLEPGTPERKACCDGLVAECLNFVCELTGKE